MGNSIYRFVKTVFGNRKPSAGPPCHAKRSRRLSVQPLEDRRLLATLEGSTFTLPRQIIDPVGLSGTLSASVDWGDGTKTDVPVTTPNVTGGIRVRFDYSLDTRNFFNTNAKRALLQEAADSTTRYLQDQLTAITPSGQNSWAPFVCHPSQGASNALCGPLTDVSNRASSIAANEIVVFVGSRDLIANVRGAAGPGAFSANGTQAWLETVVARGQSGISGTTHTDFSTWGGSISFDTAGTDWYFGRDAAGIQDGQTDFMTVAAHELLHVLGFGYAPSNVTSSWERLVSGGRFNGAQARANYVGPGSPAVHGGHWETDVDDFQLTLMREVLSNGERQTLTRLDLAALDDIGWQVTYPGQVVIDASHVYGDDGDFNVQVTLRGSRFGERVIDVTVADINNAPPVLTVPGTQRVLTGQQLLLPREVWQIIDPGFGNSSANPPSSETFSFVIDWGDGTQTSDAASVLTQGNATRDTVASFAAVKSYPDAGTYTVTATVSDDDGGRDVGTFRVIVSQPPQLVLALDKETITENDGDRAATLTVTRTGPALDEDQTIALLSSDESEATLAASVVILAGATSATAVIKAEDDTILDGTRTTVLTAQANGLERGQIVLLVQDHETLSVNMTASSVVEDQPSTVFLNISRSITSGLGVLRINVSGGDADQLDLAPVLVIPRDSQSVRVPLTPIDDTDVEAPLNLSYSFSAEGYIGDTADVRLLDDEPPKFQNPTDPFDVDGSNEVTANDALRVINELGQRAGSPQLDPNTESPDGVFVDATGDYALTSLDALVIINEIARRRLESERVAESEIVNMTMLPEVERNETETSLPLYDEPRLS